MTGVSFVTACSKLLSSVYQPRKIESALFGTGRAPSACPLFTCIGSISLPPLLSKLTVNDSAEWISFSRRSPSYCTEQLPAAL